MSTKAAAEYLATLHDEAGDDWPMTLVAWNNGDRAMRSLLVAARSQHGEASAIGCRGEPAV